MTEPEDIKRVTQTVAPVESVPWWKDVAVRMALGTVLVPGLYQILVHAGVKMPLAEEHFTPLVVNGLVVGGGVVWLIRRIKRGTDPNDPAPKLVLKKKE